MKKLLQMKFMLLLCALIVGSGTMWADKETITLSEQGYSNQQLVSSTQGTVVTLTYDKGTSNTSPAYYNAGTGVRVYAGGKMTVTASDNTITKVIVTYTKEKGPTIGWSSNGETTTATTGTPATWEGSATSVDFTVSTAGHARIQAVEVTYTTSGGGDTPTTWTVTYNANGASSGTVPVDNTEYNAQNNIVTVLDNTGNLAKEHYTFNNWNTAANGSGEGYKAGDKFEISANTTLYAQWAINSYNVTLPAQDEYGAYEMNVQNPVAYGTEVTLTYNPASGYEKYVAAWSVNGTALEGNKFTMPDEDVTVTVELTEITIDFESAATDYTDWTFTNIVSNYTNSGVTAHGGSKYGSTNQKETGSIQTKEKVNPASLTCYVSKQTNNASSSTWYIQVSSDGSTWTEVANTDAKDMNKGEWKKFTAALSNYSDVYVRVYYSGSTAVRLIDDLTLVLKNDTRAEAGLAFAESSYSVELFNATSFNSPALTNPHELPITWTSSNETVATVNEGTVTILSEGETTIKAKFEGNDDYKPGEASYVLTVDDSRLEPTVTIDATDITNTDVYAGTEAGSLSATVTYDNTAIDGASVTWSGDNDAVATIDEATGVVTLVAAGTVTFTATYAGNEDYKAKTATFEMTVIDNTPVETVTYSLAKTFKPGKHYIIVGKKDNDFYAMGGQNANNRAAVPVTDNDGTISVAKDGSISEFLIDIAGVYYSIYDEAYNENAGGYLYAASSSNNYLKTQEANDANGRWEITIDSDTGVATVKAKESNNRNVMRFNSTSTLFSCYNGGQQDIYLYENDNELVIPIAAACTDGTKCYSTFSSSMPFVVPEGLTVSEIKILSDGTMKVESYDTDDVVPADRGVMVSAAKGGNYVVNISKEAGTSKLGTSNALRPSGDNGITADEMDGKDSGFKFYRLTMHNDTQIGFWWGAAEGAAFAVGPNKAYMAVPAGQAAREGFAFDDDSTTGISNVNVNENVNGSVFDLQGRKVSTPGKGLYIVNGKKVVIK